MGNTPKIIRFKPPFRIFREGGFVMQEITGSQSPSDISVEKTKRICGFTNSVEYDIILVVTK